MPQCWFCATALPAANATGRPRRFCRQACRQAHYEGSVTSKCGMQVVHADCLAYMPTMPPESVHCCLSSPPYFGLRDYQTGSWVGGDPDCGHLKGSPAKSIASSGLNHPESTSTG